ncbi:hypothetical protein PGN05_12360 [Geodermatophilus sp. CPCC 206100]
MNERDEAELGWTEEAVTAVAVHKGAPAIKVVEFNRQQEGRGVGADYLWWWLDHTSDECFGMLVQAKRLHRRGDSWQVDIRHRNGSQYRDLLATADQFQVPALYGVYTGGLVFREALLCSHRASPDCVRCRRMAISMITAYQLSSFVSPVDTAELVLTEAVPLEDLVDPSLPAGVVWDLNLSKLGPGDLRDFLVKDQHGPREVAKRIFSSVAKHRRGAFAAALAERTILADEPIFENLPSDTGHFPGPYFPHILRGLRVRPPSYVVDVQVGRPAPLDLVDRLAGVVVVTL